MQRKRKTYICFDLFEDDFDEDYDARMECFDPDIMDCSLDSLRDLRDR